MEMAITRESLLNMQNSTDGQLTLQKSRNPSKASSLNLDVGKSRDPSDGSISLGD